MQSALAGFALGFSLILAIGAQNAFVLRQGIRRAHVGAVVAACALSDIVLIAAGVAGFGTLVAAAPMLGPAARWGGAVFLVVYGALSLRRAAFVRETLSAEGAAEPSRTRAVLAALAFSWFNPHVYLDTLVLVGAVAAQYGPGRWAFGAGAATSSVVFFIALGYGARLLAPLFARPAAWRVLDAGVGLLMWTIAAALVWP